MSQALTYTVPGRPEAVVLAIDPGARGGWCVVSPSGVRASGPAKSADDRQRAVLCAVAASALNEAPVVAVVERWTAGGARGHAQWVGLGSARGRWLEALELAGVTRVVDVYPQTWRTLLKGLPRRTGEQAKASALLVARGLMQRECGPDEAEAVCIAAWAARSPEVAAMAAKKMRAKRAAPGAVKPRSAKRAASALTSSGLQEARLCTQCRSNKPQRREVLCAACLTTWGWAGGGGA